MKRELALLVVCAALPFGCSDPDDATNGSSNGGGGASVGGAGHGGDVGGHGMGGNGDGTGGTGGTGGKPPGPHTIVKPVMTEYAAAYLRGDGTLSKFVYLNPPGQVLMT